MPRILIQRTDGPIAPIKLDGKVYSVVGGSHSFLENEKITTARHTANGGIDFQRIETGCHRLRMTLRVPVSTDYVTVEDADFTSSSMGTLSNLQTTADKLAPSDLLDFYDIDSEWDFSGGVPYNVYMDSINFCTPFNNDIGLWDIPITLWGKDA